MKKEYIYILILSVLISCAPSIDGNTFCDTKNNNTPTLNATVMKLFITEKTMNKSVFSSSVTGFNRDSFRLFADKVEITFDTNSLNKDTIKTQQWYVLYNLKSNNLILKYNKNTKDTISIRSTYERNICQNVVYENHILDSIFVKNKKIDIESSTKTYIIKR
ncbi:MAG: hypothetical protein EAZ53_10920 [Bacteroidetes bacterium]|nr:MAG: hypothetical protein EAZ53_10920 [Bacteroidota bacterium]